MCDEAHVVHQELDTRSGDSYTSLEGIHWLAVTAKVVRDRGKQTMFRDDGLLANIVK
jgi:hypothetical protein